jgi:hypothetical protein
VKLSTTITMTSNTKTQVRARILLDMFSAIVRQVIDVNEAIQRYGWRHRRPVRGANR